MEPFPRHILPERMKKLNFLDNRLIRIEKKYLDTAGTLEEAKIAETHFEKLRQSGMHAPLAFRVIGADPSSSQGNQKRLIYGVCELRKNLRPVAERDLFCDAFRDQVLGPLTIYYDWSLTQDYVFTDLVHYTEENPVSAWNQFSYDNDMGGYILHDVDTEIDLSANWLTRTGTHASLGHIKAIIPDESPLFHTVSNLQQLLE